MVGAWAREKNVVLQYGNVNTHMCHPRDMTGKGCAITPNEIHAPIKMMYIVSGEGCDVTL